MELVNGEAVEVDIRHARVGSRGLALLLDMVVEVLLALAVFIAGSAGAEYAVRGAVDDALVNTILTLSTVVAFVAYPTLMETLTNGRSLGKRAMGLRVVREDGGPIRVRHALTRSLVGVAVEWPGLLFPPFTWAVALTTMIASPRGRRLGDLAAGTFVVHERTPAPWGWVPAMPPPLAQWATGLELTDLDDDLALAARHYLARVRDIREPMSSRLAHELAAEVSERIARPVPPGVPAWMFLSAVLAERRRRAGERVHTTRALTQRIWPGFGRSSWPAPGTPAWDPAVTHPPILGIAKEARP
ncbi:RDD family protein [Actinoplanes sp. N902-109]|uniref:RDD family protein n=1 Tax=Actinoplanes sp. (strain N902-109) TaxID=649831 RepID=UPI0003293662|nr:RDD family protein [Actinoplanes sp. N902-109]AGL15232.1 RDD domain-containing protein [Actinoplanes sp. N902-109]